MPTATPELDERVESAESVQPDRPWKVLLWNDDVNDLGFVIRVLQRVIQKPEDVCERIAHVAHSEGKAPAFSGAKEAAQQKAAALGAASLWATIEKG